MARDERRRPHRAPAIAARVRGRPDGRPDRHRRAGRRRHGRRRHGRVATAPAAGAPARAAQPTAPGDPGDPATPATPASRRTARRPPTRRRARPRSRASPRRARRRPRANRPAPSRRRARRRPSDPPRSARPASPAPPCPASPGSGPTSPPATSASARRTGTPPSTATELRVDVANTGQAAARFALLYTLPAGVTDAGTEGCAPAGGQSYRCGAWTARAGAGWSMRIKVRVDGDAWERMPLMGSVQVTASAPGLVGRYTTTRASRCSSRPARRPPASAWSPTEVNFGVRRRRPPRCRSSCATPARPRRPVRSRWSCPAA